MFTTAYFSRKPASTGNCTVYGVSQSKCLARQSMAVLLKQLTLRILGVTRTEHDQGPAHLVWPTRAVPRAGVLLAWLPTPAHKALLPSRLPPSVTLTSTLKLNSLPIMQAVDDKKHKKWWEDGLAGRSAAISPYSPLSPPPPPPIPYIECSMQGVGGRKREAVLFMYCSTSVIFSVGVGRLQCR